MIMNRLPGRGLVSGLIITFTLAGVPKIETVAAKVSTPTKAATLDQGAAVRWVRAFMSNLNVEAVRAKLIELQKDGEEHVAPIASRNLLLLDLTQAKTKADRRAILDKLAVTVQSSRATDGRDGMIKRFAVHGKTQFEVFVPAQPLRIMHQPDLSSGPSATEAADDCYDGAEPCVSQDDMDEIGAEVAAAQATEDQGWSDYYAACNVDPSSCTGEPPLAEGSCLSCWGEAGEATGALLSGGAVIGGAYLEYSAGIAAGLTLTTAGAAVLIAGVLGASFGIGFYVGSFAACCWYANQSTVESEGLDPYEPAFPMAVAF